MASFTDKALIMQRNYALECEHKEAYKIFVQVAKKVKNQGYF